jgi:hypothetical protein
MNSRLQLLGGTFHLIFLLFLLLELIVLSHIYAASGSNNMTSEEAAVKAVRDHNSVWHDFELKAREESTSCIRNSRLYKVWVTRGVHPIPVFLVFIGDDNIPYVFPASGAHECSEGFSKVIAKENINVSHDNVREYLERVLCLLDNHAFVINRGSSPK